MEDWGVVFTPNNFVGMEVFKKFYLSDPIEQFGTLFILLQILM